MKARLIGKTGNLAGKEFSIEKEVTIGKGSENSIVLSHRFVSRRHARLYYDGMRKCYYLEDLKSQNGTRIDGERVRKKERLSNIHLITFGNRLDFFFVVQKDSATKHSNHQYREALDESAVNSSKNKQEQSRKITVIVDSQNKSKSNPVTKTLYQTPAPPQKKATTPPGYILDFKDLKKKVVLAEGLNVVGRTSECDVVIDNHTISRQHACISIRQGIVQVNDLESKNRTFVNNRVIKSNADVQPDSQIKFGSVMANLTSNL